MNVTNNTVVMCSKLHACGCCTTAHNRACHQLSISITSYFLVYKSSLHLSYCRCVQCDVINISDLYLLTSVGQVVGRDQWMTSDYPDICVVHWTWPWRHVMTYVTYICHMSRIFICHVYLYMSHTFIICHIHLSHLTYIFHTSHVTHTCHILFVTYLTSIGQMSRTLFTCHVNFHTLVTRLELVCTIYWSGATLTDQL